MKPEALRVCYESILDTEAGKKGEIYYTSLR